MRQLTSDPHPSLLRLTWQQAPRRLHHGVDALDLVVKCGAVSIIKVDLRKHKFSVVGVGGGASVWVDVGKDRNLYALCGGLQGPDETLGITGGCVSYIHMSLLESGGHGQHPPGGVCSDVHGALQEVWEVPREIELDLSGCSEPQDLTWGGGGGSPKQCLQHELS